MPQYHKVKKIIFRADKSESPCKACPKCQECLDKDLTCEALVKWQAENRTRSNMLVFSAT